jgi:WhiB family transcriptional regulator, redox-sensing transcriptional regulator
VKSEMSMHAMTRHYADPDGWAAQGACRHSDPELFFPVSSAGPAAGQVARAKMVCADCPVKPQCLEFALQSGQDFGVWGGTTESERRAMRRRHRRHRRVLANRDG